MPIRAISRPSSEAPAAASVAVTAQPKPRVRAKLVSNDAQADVATADRGEDAALPQAEPAAAPAKKASRKATTPKYNPDGSRIGKNNPPVSGQFKPGQSGNPGGPKKKQLADPDMAVILVMEEIKTVGPAGGPKKKMSGAEALMHKTYERAFKGDMRATKLLFELYAKAKANKAPSDDAGGGDALSDAEREMLAALLGGLGTQGSA